MLINCPKCGFSQPKDRYCAKCGVDMESFRPESPSIMRRFLGHPALHIVAIFVMVLAAIIYIKARRNENFLSQAEKIPKGIAVVDRTSLSTSENSASPEQAMASGEENSAQEVPTPMPQAINSATVPTTGPTGAQNQTASLMGKNTMSDEAHRTTRVTISYAEVDDLTLKKWMPEMQASGQYFEAGWKMGMLPNIEKRLAEDRSIITLETVQKSFDSVHSAAEWLNGRQNERGEFGFKSNLNVMDPESGLLKAEFRILRMVENTDPKIIDAEFELPPKAGWVIWDILKPKSSVPEELMSDPKSLFQIFKSARFKSRRSDFTIILVFDTPSGR